MKTYLLKHWNANFIFGIMMIIAAIILTALFCILYPDRENYILIIGLSGYFAAFGAVICIASKLVRYITEENGQLVMYSLRKKKKGYLNTHEDIYYEILTLTEGMYCVNKFVVLSNVPFESYKRRSKKKAYFGLGLGTVCRLAEADGRQIVLPYEHSRVSSLLSSEKCHIVG